MKRKTILLFLLLLSIMSFAQVKTITGTVTDASGEPIIGASIKEVSTSNASVTDIDGHFTISCNEGANLEFTYVGYQTQRAKAKDGMKVIMTEDDLNLNELVVIGYGVQKKSSMTASVSSVSAKELNKMSNSNVASALIGRSPGVEVLQNGGQAGGDVSIVIRGTASFGSTEPLYIIDGAESANGLNSLNAADIQSIEILKDGSAAAIYGSRAANGVVLVTTKQGVKGDTKVEIHGDYTLQTLSKKLDFMNASQWREYANMVADNSAAYSRASENVNPSNPNYSQDWQDLYYHNASQYTIGATISGGGDNSTFATSLGYTDQDGVIVETAYKKYNARVNGTYKKGRLSISESLALAHTYRQEAMTTRYIQMPTIPVKDELGRYVSTPGNAGYSITNADITNGLAQLYAQDAYTRKTDITGNVNLTYDLVAGLKYKLNIAGSYLNAHGYTHTPEYASYWDADGNADSRFCQPYTSLDETRGETFNYNIDNMLSYNNSFGKHNVDALLGTSWMREYYRDMEINSGINDLGSASVTTYNGDGNIGSNELNSALLSFFARVNYDYDSKYLLSASIRSDKSSKFAKGHRVGYFPALSAGWNIDRESFFRANWISKMKLRVSYGQMGANFIDPYSFTNLAYGPVPTIFGSTRYYGYVTRYAQNDLTWEKCISGNVGLEMGFLNDMFLFTAEWYKKRNNDLLAPLESLPSSGQTIVINDGDVPYYNTASVENSGFEFSLGYRNRWGDFSVDAQANITFLKNKVISLGQGVQPIRGTLMSEKFNDRPTITKEGLPIGTFWGYKVVGMSDDGNFLFEGADGTAKEASEVSEDDKQVLGDPIPDFTYGLNVNLGYKNWDMTLFFQGSQGNDIFAAAKYQFIFNADNNCLTEALDSWTSTNTNAHLPKATTDNFFGGNALPSSYYVEDGSYLRLKNLQLGYTFTDKQLKRVGFIKAARLYASVQNLFTITGYSLYDPEVSSNTLFDRGVDGLEYRAPQINTRSYSIGFNVTF